MQPVEPGPGREQHAADGAGRREHDPRGSGADDALWPEDEHRRARACGRADGQLAEHDDRDEDRDGVEHGGVDPDGVQHEPVAGDLRDDGDEDEADEPGAAVRGAQDGEATEDRASVGRPAAARPAAIATVTATQTIGVHHGSPSGPTSVKGKMPARTPSTARIGTSAAISAVTHGDSVGAERRTITMRAADPA